MRRVTIFGATGSIGQNTIDLIRRDRDAYDVVGLSGAGNIEQLAADACDLGAEIAVTADETRYAELKDALSGSGVTAAAGADAL
ncbi:MAG: 1-deoxy-D-xylulose-5-phosphate reductoisomerase, partial [Pseudomonadota bacterium]